MENLKISDFLSHVNERIFQMPCPAFLAFGLARLKVQLESVIQVGKWPYLSLQAAASHLFGMDALSSLKVALMPLSSIMSFFFKSLVFYFRRLGSKGHLKIDLWGQKE